MSLSSLRLNLLPLWDAGPSTQPVRGSWPTADKATQWALGAEECGLWVQRSVAVHGGNMAERNTRWGLSVLHCGIPRHDIRNVPLEVWELWDC